MSVLVFLLRRLVTSLLVLFGTVTMIFIILRVIPGDPILQLAGDIGRRQDIELLRHKLGLDQPIYVQYLDYLGKVAQGNLDFSLRTGRDVTLEIAESAPATMELAVAGLLLSVLIGLPMGIYSAIRHGSWIDNLFFFISVVGISVPSFWVGLLLIVLFAVQLHLLPSGGQAGLPSLILPAVTLALSPTMVIARTMRASLLETLGKDYLRTARAKGLAAWAILVRHALPNALIPVITIIGINFGTMLSGTIIVETIFAWPGIGSLMIESIDFRDFPMIQGLTLLLAFLFLIVNLAADLTYAIVDPRIRYRGNS